MITKIEFMLDKQEELNNLTNGDDWKEGLTNKNRKIDWLRCIRKEVSELIDSFPWEHWKSLDKKADIDNALIELVDIWFFLMSYILHKFRGYDSKDMIKLVAEALTVKRLSTSGDVIYLSEELAKATYDIITTENYKDKINYLLYRFVKLMDSLNVDVDALHNLYIGKLALNKFRQDNGYKEGTYKKMWTDVDLVVKEDNKIMLAILRHITKDTEVTESLVYNALTNKYYAEYNI